ncbi:hypothetical protein [Thermotoga sp. KOL6]|uniref:hypothetical protein n=1 Tax=Thermotoga sp. KOL6 TaxID=126741 RepID=UPI001E29C077|nr:hypothetical protein [Thermotoga sp. KOL6]
MFAFNYKIEENGILYFLGDSTPTTLELEIVQEWKKLPVVTLVYDGPVEYKGIVEDLLSQEGILTGTGTPLIVKIRTKDEYVAFQIVFEDKSIDNFENLTTKDLFPEQFRKTVREVFPSIQIPSEFFLIEYKDGVFEKKIAYTKDYEKKSPVIFLPLWSEEHILEIGDYRKVVKEGFYQIGGKTVYVGRDISMENVPGLYRNVEMVFLDGEREYLYKDGFLRLGEKVLKIEEPVDIVNGVVITRHRIGYRKIEDTIIFRWNDFVLTASGSLMGINGRWTWKVSKTPVEYSIFGSMLYILDVCGFLRKYDIKTRQLVWEKKIEGAWGVDATEDKVFVGSENTVMILNAQDGETIEILEADDFAVWNGKLLVYKNGILNGEKIEGFFIRNFGTPLFVSKDKIIMFGDEKKVYENAEKIRVFQWGTVIKAGDKLWLIKRD